MNQQPDQYGDLSDRVAAALRSREPRDADVDLAARRIAARVADTAGERDVTSAPPAVRPGTRPARRAGRIALAGVFSSVVVAGCSTAAAAADPYSGFAAVVDGVAQAVGVDWTSMPAGYTRAQHDAFWGAGYTAQDLATLDELWGTESLETKARAGQMLLDGAMPPVAPGSAGSAPAADVRPTPEQLATFDGSGYTPADAELLAELWDVGQGEAKARVADMIEDGRTPPVP